MNIGFYNLRFMFIYMIWQSMATNCSQLMIVHLGRLWHRGQLHPSQDPRFGVCRPQGLITPNTDTKRQRSSQPKVMDSQPPSTELYSHPSLPGHRSPGPPASQNAGIEYLQTLVFIAKLDLTMFSTALRSAESKNS